MTKECRKRRHGCGRLSSLKTRHSSLREGRAAFTIIELLVVIAIIISLAAMILGTVGYVQKKGARSRAESEIAAISAACESYKADNGTYPTGNADPTSTTTPTDTDALDPQLKGDPSASNYTNASLALYNLLTGATTKGARTATGKSYLAFKPNQLSPTDQTLPVAYIRDPFGNSYGYSTMKASGGTSGYNPTFDLWSTGGDTTATPTSTSTAQWLKNW